MKTVGDFHSMTMNSSPPAPKEWHPTGTGDIIFTHRGKLVPAACSLYAIYDLGFINQNISYYSSIMFTAKTRMSHSSGAVET